MPRTDWSELEAHLLRVPSETDMLSSWETSPEAFVHDIVELAKAAYSEGYQDGLYDAVREIDRLGVEGP